jgi:hypothetical protein
MKSYIPAIQLLLLITVSPLLARTVVFIGVNGSEAPAIEKTYDRLLRENLTITPDIQLVDFLQSERYKQQINFFNYPVVSKELVEKLSRFVEDTTFFIWGTVEKCQIKPARKFLFHSVLEGELVVSLTMYSLSDRAFAYSGVIKATYSKPKGIVFFRPVDQMTHISALDRTEILEKLEYSVVKNSCKMISAVIRSDLAHNGENVDINKYNVKAVNSVMSVPVMPAKELPAEPGSVKSDDISTVKKADDAEEKKK